MKLATYKFEDQIKVGLVYGQDRRLFDLDAASRRAGRTDPAYASMLALVDRGHAALEQASSLFDRYAKDDDLSLAVDRAEILAPLPEPRQMRDGMSFPRHIVQSPIGHLKLKARKAGDMAELALLEAAPLPELPEIYRKQPIYYMTNRFSVQGTNTTVKWPRYSQVMDYELEFGIVTQKRERTFPPQGHATTYSATRFSMIFPPATLSASRWRAGWVRPRARVSTGAMSSGPGS